MNIFKKKTDTLELTIANETVIKVIILTVLSLFFIAALQKASHALILIFTSFFLALALNVPVRWLGKQIPGKKKHNRIIATSISFVIIIGFLIAFLVSIVPPLVKQTTNFINVAPQLIDDARDENTSLGSFIRRYHLQDQTEKLSSELSDKLSNVGVSAFTTFNKITSSIFSTLTILVLTFMMLIEGPFWMKYFLRLVPKEKEEHLKDVASKMYAVITGYVNGQVTLAALASVLILVPLFAFNVSYPIALMVIVFICGLIPLVGHTIGAIIVSTVALFGSVVSAIGVLAFYILYQQIENYILQPKIQANSTNMSPLLVFSSVIIGVNFGGLFGGLVAIPVAGCMKILIIEFIKTKRLIPEK